MADKWTTLGDVVVESRGGTSIKTSEYTSSGTPVLTKGDVKPFGCVEHGGKFVNTEAAKRNGWRFSKAGDLIVTTRDLTLAANFLGLVSRVPEHDSFVINQGATIFRIDESKMDPRYLVYWCCGGDYRQHIQESYVGSTQIHIRQEDLFAAPVKLLPIAQQKAIATVLGALDDKIELNRRMNATLEATARALFQSWFVDFDPVRSKLDGRPLAALDPATAALFPEHLEETALGHTPKGWEVCPLSEKIQLLSGGTPKTSEPTYWDGDIPWYSVRDAPSETDVWVIRTDKHVTKLGIANSAAQIFPEKTTIISARGTVGKLALTAVPMAMNQSCYGVRGVTGYGDYFTYYSLREATAQLQQRTHGTVFDTITTETFKTLDCIFPTPKITAAFDKLVEPLLGQIRANLHQSRTLATLRDTLLPKLLSGELSVAPTDKESLSVQNTSKKS